MWDYKQDNKETLKGGKSFVETVKKAWFKIAKHVPTLAKLDEGKQNSLGKDFWAFLVEKSVMVSAVLPTNLVYVTLGDSTRAYYKPENFITFLCDLFGMETKVTLTDTILQINQISVKGKEVINLTKGQKKSGFQVSEKIGSNGKDGYSYTPILIPSLFASALNEYQLTGKDANGNDRAIIGKGQLYKALKFELDLPTSLNTSFEIEGVPTSNYCQIASFIIENEIHGYKFIQYLKPLLTESIERLYVQYRADQTESSLVALLTVIKSFLETDELGKPMLKVFNTYALEMYPSILAPKVEPTKEGETEKVESKEGENQPETKPKK